MYFLATMLYNEHRKYFCFSVGIKYLPAIYFFVQIGELRSGSPRLIKLNDFIRRLHKKGALDVLSFCEVVP